MSDALRADISVKTDYDDMSVPTLTFTIVGPVERSSALAYSWAVSVLVAVHDKLLANEKR